MVLLCLALLATGWCAEAQMPMTRHVPEAVRNGRAARLGRLASTSRLRLTLVLPLRNQAGLEALVKQIEDPSSPNYKHYLTPAEFAAQFGPSAADYSALASFATEHNLKIVGRSSNRVNLDVEGSVSDIEQTMHVKMDVYQHPTQNRRFFAPDREPTPNTPVNLWHIAGLDNYTIPHPAGLVVNPNQSANATVGSGPSASFLGSDMRAAYYGSTALTGAGQSVGLMEYYGADPDDLATYYTTAKQTLNVPIVMISTDGTSLSCLSAQGCDDTEQILDMTQVLGMAPGLSSLMVYVGSSDVAILNAMATSEPLANTLCSSWTWSPADPAVDDPYFMEFAAQGQSFIQAAGDQAEWTAASAIYPADDDYVTTVGGTNLYTSRAGGPWTTETAWSNSGGGSSPNGIPIPSWQSTTASQCSYCSQSLRNGPDVSANAGYSFLVCSDQKACTTNYWGGTSFAAPMWAGFIALVNQQSLINGYNPAGFLNPSLYSLGAGATYATSFHDITSGGNGLPAGTGYDPVTGWGSPKLALVSNLAAATSTDALKPRFSLGVSATNLQAASGQTATGTVTITPLRFFAGNVLLNCAGLPAGTSCTFQKNPLTVVPPRGLLSSQPPVSTTVTVSQASALAPGTYPFRVVASTPAITRSIAMSFTVTQ